MNMRLVINLMGKALVLLGLFMILPLLWALYDQGLTEQLYYFYFDHTFQWLVDHLVGARWWRNQI